MAPHRNPAPSSEARGPHLSPDQRLAIVKAVEARFGLSLLPGVHATLAAMARRLIDRERIEVHELVHRIEGGSESDPVVERMRSAASIGETYFYRAPTQLRALEARVLETVVPRKRTTGRKTLRVWSSACSTGEEPYTLAILFRLALADFEISVLGTDMNESSLEIARAGVYGQRSVRSAFAKTLGGMLVENGDAWTVSPEIRQLVTFERLNLVTDLYPARHRRISDFDVVVCRNVLIYLDPARIPDVMGKLAASCSTPSVFVLTPAEYAAARHAPGFVDAAHGVLVRTPESIRPAAPSAPRPSAPRPSAPRPSAPRPSAPVRSSPKTDGFEAALETARVAADRAAFDEAHELIARARLLRPDSAEPYCLLGTTFNAMGDWQQAVREFQRALYLDRNLAAAELGLGQALFTGRQHEEARRHFDRALLLLTDLPGEAAVRVMGVTVSVARRVAASWLEEAQWRP